MQPNAENKDFTQAIRESYDPALERLRVDALITDGQDALIINNDGSINVNVVSGSLSSSPVHVYNEVLNVASGISTQINTYIVPLATTSTLQKVAVAGSNIAEYEVKVNGVTKDKIYTYFSNLNAEFNIETYQLQAGDVVTVFVLHNRPTVGNFNSRIQVLEV